MAAAASPYLTHGEVEFLAEYELVTITPNFSMDELHFISGTYGPFQPPRSTVVPLWLAVTLKKKQKCRIHPPAFLDVDFLAKQVDRERTVSGEFVAMPYHFMEMAHLILDCAENDVRQPNQVRALLEDLRELRHMKVRKGVGTLLLETKAVDLTNMGALELNDIRPFLLRAMEEVSFMSVMSQEEDVDQEGEGDQE